MLLIIYDKSQRDVCLSKFLLKNRFHLIEISERATWINLTQPKLNLFKSSLL